MTQQRRIVLASKSPRRRQLLEAAGFIFEVDPPDDNVECGICSRESPPELVARLAFQKAEDVAKRTENALVIGCDTVAECSGQILGKPANREHARQMLTLMSGRRHHVYSGLSIWQMPAGKHETQVAVTRLEMASFDEATLEAYLDTDQWVGKAGAFGYQDGLDWVRIMEGSESNVVGLPMELLAEMLGRVE